MRKPFLAAVAVAAVTVVPAVAADIPGRAPVLKAPVAQTVASWTGCYVAVGGGYGLWNQDSTRTSNPTFGPVTVLSTTTTSGGRGYFGTVGGGCDYQVSDRFVVGALANYDFASLKGSYTNATSNEFANEKLRSSWAVGGRVGWLVTPTVLAYVSGGYTEARFGRADLFFGGIPPSTVSHIPATTYSGWFIGSGTEFMLASGWFVRSEYRYARYDNKYTPEVITATGAEFNNGTDNEKFVQTVRAELLWKWNGGATTTAAPARAQPVTNWNGCHVAAGGGYGMWNQDMAYQTDPILGPVTVFTPVTTAGGRGWFGTVGGGCDYQMSERWVVGAIADYDFADLKSDYGANYAVFFGSEKMRSAWAAGGRIGWLFTPTILTYFDGGYTQARFSKVDQISLATPPVSFGSHFAATTYSGWFMGGGTEIALIPSWSLRSEYRYARYGNEFVPLLNTATGTRTGVGLDSEKVVQTVRTELVWKWNWGGPVRAAY